MIFAKIFKKIYKKVFSPVMFCDTEPIIMLLRLENIPDDSMTG